jgi:hypothetical protein
MTTRADVKRYLMVTLQHAGDIQVKVHSLCGRRHAFRPWKNTSLPRQFQSDRVDNSAIRRQIVRENRRLGGKIVLFENIRFRQFAPGVCKYHDPTRRMVNSASLLYIWPPRNCQSISLYRQADCVRGINGHGQS